MKRLMEGFARFRREVFPRQRQLFQQLATNQKPRALFITCADSRIVPDLITQSSPGDLFICRNAGNIVPPYGEVNGGVSATIEYAVMALEVKNIIVCGHSDCGAMKGLMHPEKLQTMPTVASWLRNAEVALRVARESYPELSEEAMLHALIEENVVAQLEHLKSHPSVAARLAKGDLNLYGWVYQIHSGEIMAFDAQRGGFVALDPDSLTGEVAPSATPQRRLASTAANLQLAGGRK